MMFFLFAVWGADIFVLYPRGRGLLKRDAGGVDRILFFLSLSLYIFSQIFFFPVSFSVFSLVLVVSLSLYLSARLKNEVALSRYASDQDGAFMKESVFFLFIGTILKWFWGVLILSAVIETGGRFFPAVLGDDLAAASLLSLTAGLWMILLALRFGKQVVLFTRKELFGLSCENKSAWIAWIWPVVIGIIFSLVSSFLLMQYFSQVVTPFSEALDGAEMSWVMIFFLSAAIFVAPFLEEVIFRGFFFKVIQECKGRWWAFWVIGTAFGLLHMDQYWGNAASIGSVFLLGFFLTGFRMFSGSARPAIVLHYTFNIMMVFVPAVFFVSSRPVFSEYYVHRSDLSLFQKKYLLEESINEDPQNALAYDEFARFHLDHGFSLEQALAYADQALSLMPDRTIFQLTRADILYAMGRQEEAVAFLQEAHQQLPASREVVRRLEKMKGKE